MMEKKFDRRELLTTLGVGALSLLGNGDKSIAKDKTKNLPEVKEPELDEVEFIRKVNQINTVSGERWGFVFDPVDFQSRMFNVYGNEVLEVKPEENLKKILQTIEELFQTFERNFPQNDPKFKNTGLIKKIVIGKNILKTRSKNEFPLQGYADYAKRTLFFSTEKMFDPKSGNFLREIAIHEVSHLVTFIKIREKNGNIVPLQDYWMESIYPIGEKHGDKARVKDIYLGLNNSLFKERVRPEGFAREYGRANFMEDFATVSEIMFEPNGSFVKGGWLDASMVSDVILMRKCRFVARLYKEIFGIGSGTFELKFKEAGYEGVLPWE